MVDMELSVAAVVAPSAPASANSAIDLVRCTPSGGCHDPRPLPLSQPQPLASTLTPNPMTTSVSVPLDGFPPRFPTKKDPTNDYYPNTRNVVSARSTPPLSMGVSAPSSSAPSFLNSAPVPMSSSILQPQQQQQAPMLPQPSDERMWEWMQRPATMSLYPPRTNAGVSMPPPAFDRFPPVHPPTSSAAPSRALASIMTSTQTTSSTAMSTAMSTTAPGQNAMKRSLSMTSASPSESPTVSVASSMIAMRNHPDALDLTQSHHHPAPRPLGMRRPSPAPTPPPHAVSQAQPSYGKSEASAGTASAKPAGEPPVKKMKVSRERQLKINAASRRCRKKQKLELHFLRTHVVELQSVLRDQIQHLRNTENHQPQDPGRIARLSAFLDESLRKVEEMSSGMRPPAASKGGNPDADVATSDPVHDDEENSYDNNGDHCLETNHVKSLDPMTEYSLNDERKRYLLHIARFMRTNITLESHSFSPDTISCLPIEMDGWQLRLAITAKNYTIHNSKFFPCNLMDMYEFCWETNVSQKMSIKQGKKHYCVVTPLDKDVAHVYSKTIGRWSLSVHGVENVSYNSLVCRVFDAEHKRAIICQQSVLEDKDLRDENTIPWLFKRWVVFKPQVVNGVEGTMVEAFRTASYATGRPIYKENNTYESFCEHLIRRYAESNALLERMMARDKRFMHVAAIDVSNENDADRDMDETASDRMVKDLLLF